MSANQLTAAIFELGSDVSLGAFCGAVAEAGCSVVAGALPQAFCGRVEGELASALAAAHVVEDDDPKPF